MSRNYFVDITLFAEFQKKSNILKILEKGCQLGFIYHDHITSKTYESSPILTPNHALEKVFKSIELNTEEGPTVYTRINEDSYAFLAFYDDEKLIKCSMFAMTNIIRKRFEENYYEIDFAFYIKLMLDLCNDFAIKKIEVGEF